MLAQKLKGQIEVLPVNVDGNSSDYYFINVLNTVNALNIESKSNEEILRMMRENNGVFNQKRSEHISYFEIVYLMTAIIVQINS